MMLKPSVTLFIPKQLEQKDCYLYGRYSTSYGLSTSKELCVIVLSSFQSQPEYLVGCMRDNSHQAVSQKLGKDVWLELLMEPCISVDCVYVKGQIVSHDDITIILYDSNEIYESEIIMGQYANVKDVHQENILNFLIKCILEDEDSHIPKTTAKLSRIRFMIGILIGVLTWVPKVAMKKVQYVFIEKLDYSSKALQQLTLRISQLETLNKYIWKRTNNLVHGRLATMIGTDILLGVIVAYIISHHASVNDIYDSFCRCTKTVSSSVQDLLEWLSGAPAGLKLNQPLTQALSAFFSYHVHLWRLYLELADPLLKGVAWILVWLGMFGLSVQVAILSDLLDLATLHLYCFYVYAARIHMLQISLLGSQWRAFRGRKWNPLKERIDSDSGMHMPLKRVLTAVVFTLVIFLLPTTTVYYLVFVTLRVSLSAARKILGFCIWLLNINPLHLVLLNIIQSNTIKGNICLTSYARSTKDSPTLTFSLHTWPTPVLEALEYSKSEFLLDQPSINWRAFLSSVIFGEKLL